MKPFFVLCFLVLSIFARAEVVLKENLRHARPGDFIVVAQNKVYTLLTIFSSAEGELSIEEITVPMNAVHAGHHWRSWVEAGAPHNCSWVRYTMNAVSGEMLSLYSFTKGAWFAINEYNSFLPTLLNLPLQIVPDHLRKRVGPRINPNERDRRAIWQPRMIVDGKIVEGVRFIAYRARWPNDRSELAGKWLELYIPQEHGRYPSYFPYWLQGIGIIGKANVRIVDSGIGLKSPKPALVRQ